MEQVIFGGAPHNLLNNNLTEYNAIYGGISWNVAERSYKLISTDGIIKNLRVKLTAAPGAGTHYDFSLMLNGAPTALTVEIANAATLGDNTINEIDVTGGDYISIQCDPDTNPNAVYASWTIMFEGDTPNESLMMGGAYNTPDRFGVEYGQIFGSYTIFTNVENNYREVVPTAGTIKNFYVKLNVDPGVAPEAYRFTVRLNGATVANSPIVTITADATTGNDLVNELAVVAGDVLTMKVEPLNAPTIPVSPQWGLTFVADIDGESITIGGSSDNLNNLATEFNFLTSYEGRAWTNIEAQRYHLGQVCTLLKLHVLLSAAPGAGNDRDFSLRITGINVVTLQISDVATTGDSGVLSDTVALDDDVDLRTIPTGGPDAADAYWGFVCFIEPPLPPPSAAPPPVIGGWFKPQFEEFKTPCIYIVKIAGWIQQKVAFTSTVEAHGNFTQKLREEVNYQINSASRWKESMELNGFIFSARYEYEAIWKKVDKLEEAVHFILNEMEKKTT